jgi:hypothetical protein
MQTAELGQFSNLGVALINIVACVLNFDKKYLGERG